MSDNGKITKVTCGTTVKDSEPVVFEFHHDWSPLGVEHAVSLFEEGFFDGVPFFRVIKGFLVQFGLVYDKDLQKRLGDTRIDDDPQLDPPIPFRPGIISYAGSGENSRTSHLFVSYGSAKSLGTQPWETPLGEVTSGMETLNNLNGEYGGKPDQGKIRKEGRAYIQKEFPNMHHMTTCTIHDQGREPPAVGVEGHGDVGKQQQDGVKVEMTAATSSSGGQSFGIFSAVGGAVLCFFVLRRLLKMRGTGGTKTN